MEINIDCLVSFPLGGLYCPGGGVVNPTLPCSAGYYCRSGAETATPMEDSDAYECPVGHYCEEGTAEPVQCPVRTFSNNTRLRNETDCLPCTAGRRFFCWIMLKLSIEPCHAEFIFGNTKLNCVFSVSINMKMPQIVEILPPEIPIYPTQSI